MKEEENKPSDDGFEPETQAELELEKRILAAWSKDGGAHALILHGPDGLGKTAFARRLLSRHLRGLEAGTPCAIHPELLELTPDEGKNSIGVDAVRAFSAPLRLTSAQARRGALVTPADALGTQAANAMLKTLEEPPEGTRFILVAKSPAALPATIRSRCVIERFPVPTEKDAAARIVKRLDVSPERAVALARMAENIPGRAIKLETEGGVQRHEALLSLLGRKNPFERSGMLKLAQEFGTAWPASGESILLLIHRMAVRAAEPETFVFSSPAEREVIERLDPTREEAIVAWEIASKLRSDTDEASLDPKYAPYRMLLAIERGLSRQTTPSARNQSNQGR
jgi:hypothetical protein